MTSHKKKECKPARHEKILEDIGTVLAQAKDPNDDDDKQMTQKFILSIFKTIHDHVTPSELSHVMSKLDPQIKNKFQM